MPTFRVVDLLSSNLMLRSAADLLFDTLDNEGSETIELDFSGIESISGAFAHQYLRRRDSSSMKIIESNMPDNIRKMMEVVKNRSNSPSPRFENYELKEHTTFL
jgi:hypothetical protein